MANITAADVKKLRDATGSGMLDCKNALQEADGDYDRAVELLRIKGAKGVGKREGRTASNGLVTTVLDGTAGGVMLELNCETDFVAKTEGFGDLANQVAEIVAAQKPVDVAALLGLQQDGKTVKEILDEANATMGEKIEVRRFVRFAADNAPDGSAGYIGHYLHKTSLDAPPTIGVLIELDAEDAQLARDLAQHIAAMRPTVVTRDQISAEALATERRVAEEQAREEGKPDQIIPKIVEGRVNSFAKDQSLVDQGFAREPKTPVSKLLNDAGRTVRRFALFLVGQA